MKPSLLLLPLLLAVELAAQAPPGFSRILVPLAYEAKPGAFGTVWSTDLGVYNVSPRDVRILAPDSDVIGLTLFCPPVPNTQEYLQRRADAHVCQRSSSPIPADLIWIRSDVAPDILFSLRIRQLASGGAIPEHTEVPVVRDDDLFTDRLRLLRVPWTTADYRAMLRIYDPSGEPSQVRVTLWSFGSMPFAQAIVTLNRSSSIVEPAYAEVHLDETSFPGMSAMGRSFHVEITPITPAMTFWAMATVTDNRTQIVNVILPQ